MQMTDDRITEMNVKIAKLSLLSVEDVEKSGWDKIIKYVEMIGEVDFDGVYRNTPVQENIDFGCVLREDEIVESSFAGEIVAGAEKISDNCFVSPNPIKK